MDNMSSGVPRVRYINEVPSYNLVNYRSLPLKPSMIGSMAVEHVLGHNMYQTLSQACKEKEKEHWTETLET